MYILWTVNDVTGKDQFERPQEVLTASVEGGVGGISPRKTPQITAFDSTEAEIFPRGLCL